MFFEAAAAAFGDKDWRIDDDDSAELGERTAKWLSKLDSKSLKKLEKKADKIIPGLSLAMGLGTILVPRVRGTLAKKKNGTPAPTATSNGSANGSGKHTVAPVENRPTPVNGHAGGQQGNPGNVRGHGPVLVVERPVRREDWKEVFSSDPG